MESAKCCRCRGAKPNTHAASGEHLQKRKTNPVGEALDQVVPSVDPSWSGPQQEPDVEDDGFTAFVPLDVEYKELTPPPEQLIFSSTRNNTNFLQSIHSRRRLRQGDHWRDVVIVRLIWTYMEQMRVYWSKLSASSSVVLTDLLSKLCQCGDSHRTLNILAIYWDHHESMDIITCHCRPAADQLVA